MSNYSVRISNSAQNDILQIIEHISHVYIAPLLNRVHWKRIEILNIVSNSINSFTNNLVN